MDNDKILIESYGSTRILTLNRPRQLNVLSLDMMTKLIQVLSSYERDPMIKLLILKGNGKAFCAGGDLTEYGNAVKDHWTRGAELSSKLFTLCYIIATYNKPQVSILDGIVMGGGVGISIYGRFRVVTENTVFSMPETAIGLLGSFYLVSNLPDFIGEYISLAGAKLDGVEMLVSGLATHFVPSKKLRELEESLKKVESSSDLVISETIDTFSLKDVTLKEDSAFRRMDVIKKCFSKRTVAEIIQALLDHVDDVGDEWIKIAIEYMKSSSPLALNFTMRSIREGRQKSFEECLINDYRVHCHVFCREKASNEFLEGYRAKMVDKNRNPKWEPSSLDQVDDKLVDLYFDKLDSPSWEDFKLPTSRTSQLDKLLQLSTSKL